MNLADRYRFVGHCTQHTTCLIIIVNDGEDTSVHNMT